MRTSPNALVLTLALAAALPGPARAGQDVVEQYGLADIARDGGSVWVGRIASARPTPGGGTHIELAPSTVYPTTAPPRAPAAGLPLQVYAEPPRGEVHRSRRVRRLRGEHTDAIVGREVVAVPRNGAALYGMQADAAPIVVELLAADPATLRRVLVLFDPARKQGYLRAPVDELGRDLADPELVAIAAAELERRHGLDAKVLVGAEPRFLRQRYLALAPPARGPLASGLVEAITDESSREAVATLLFEAPEPSTLPALARLAARFDPAKVADREQLSVLRDGLVGLVTGKARAVELSAFADSLALQEVYRTGPRSDEESLERLTRRMSKPARSRVASLLLEHAYTTAGRPDDGPDEELLVEALRLCKEAPSASILAALGKVDPSRPRIESQKEETLGTMIEIALALARADAQTKRGARQLIDAWLAKGVPASAEPLQRWKRAR